jgi:hypothetical protein
MGFDLPHIAVPADGRADAARDESRRDASKQTQADAESFAQSQVNTYVQTHDRLTAGRVRELRQQIQNLANQKTPPEQFTEQQITDIMTSVLDHQPQPPGANDPEVRTAATTPTETPAEAPQGDPQPNVDDPNAALIADHGDGTDGGLARLVSGGNDVPNPRVMTARAALLPTGAPLPPPPGGAPPPPPPGAPLPGPKGPGVAPDGPLVAGGDATGDHPPIVGDPVVVAPGVPLVVDAPVESPTPRVGNFQFASLGEPVKGMNGEEQQQVYGDLLNFAANLRVLTAPVQAPVPQSLGDGFALADSSYSCSTSDDSSSSSSASADGASSSSGARRKPGKRELSLGLFRCGIRA